MMPSVKRHKNRNHYLLTPDGLWVRDFTRRVAPVDINRLTTESDYAQLLKNYTANLPLRLAKIDAETIYAPKVVIVSDGYQFADKIKLLEGLDITIIGVNRSLAKWQTKAKMDYYLTNNPYAEALSYLPQTDYYPKCIVSCRTYPEFIRRYLARKGVMYQYAPVPDERFSLWNEQAIYHIDDYRNPICAAIGLAYRWHVQKLLLFCCDDAFVDNRPGSVRLPNGLFTYPHHIFSHGLIDGNLHWLLNDVSKVITASHSSGPECQHAPYISSEAIREFL